MLSIDGEDTAIGELNPIRYRGYYQDTETGLYYLQSRYYDPTTMRFINADDPNIIQMGSAEKQELNLYAYCVNDPVNCVDPSGYFVVRRWMISSVIDVLLMLIPGIGAAFAPIKSLAKAYGKAALKTKIRTPLVAFIKFIARSASTIIRGFQKMISYIPLVGKWLASKIPIKAFTNMIAGTTSSGVINKILNVLIPNIDIVLSIGGAVAGFLDYIFDKKLNNSIWVI